MADAGSSLPADELTELLEARLRRSPAEEALLRDAEVRWLGGWDTPPGCTATVADRLESRHVFPRTANS